MRLTTVTVAGLTTLLKRQQLLLEPLWNCFECFTNSSRSSEFTPGRQEMMKKYSKKAGLTTMEVAVASTVLVGVVFMSFDVMLKSVTGVQVQCRPGANDEYRTESKR
ncbi:MAG: hypothetical protein R2688_04120 [Fimbriimonadaceae bacterium]